jgi:large subunit ribosomal protein L12
MEYIYSAMLLNSAGAEIDAKSGTKVLKAAGLKTDKARAEAPVAAPQGVDIEEAMATAAVAAPAAAAAPAASGDESGGEAPAEEAEAEEEEVSEEEAVEGLGALFG